MVEIEGRIAGNYPKKRWEDSWNISIADIDWEGSGRVEEKWRIGSVASTLNVTGQIGAKISRKNQ